MSTLTHKLSALAVIAVTLAATGSAYAGGTPVHGIGSTHDPIIFHPVHGVNSSHDPIICTRGIIPGTLDCHHDGSSR